MKFLATYFKYTGTGKESIKTESFIGKTRLINLLETSELFIDVFHVENQETGEIYLDDAEGQSLLLDDLKHPGVNSIFQEVTK
jgi:hypothetical protein